MNEIVIWLHGLIDDLHFYEDDAERFEKAAALLGLAVGFETQRPEAELGKGPDDLWALGGLRFLVIECKNGATTTTIAKKDADQLAGSLNWFRGAYDLSCDAVPVMVHPALVFHGAASPMPDVRIIDEECLGKIRAELSSYANTLVRSERCRRQISFKASSLNRISPAKNSQRTSQRLQSEAKGQGMFYKESQS